jgi:hypothetical protein
MKANQFVPPATRRRQIIAAPNTSARLRLTPTIDAAPPVSAPVRSLLPHKTSIKRRARKMKKQGREVVQVGAEAPVSSAS